MATRPPNGSNNIKDGLWSCCAAVLGMPSSRQPQNGVQWAPKDVTVSQHLCRRSYCSVVQPRCCFCQISWHLSFTTGSILAIPSKQAPLNFDLTPHIQKCPRSQVPRVAIPPRHMKRMLMLSSRSAGAGYTQTDEYQLSCQICSINRCICAWALLTCSCAYSLEYI